MSSQHRKQSTSLNFGRYFVIKVSIRFKGEVHLENHYAILMDLSIKEFGPKNLHMLTDVGSVSPPFLIPKMIFEQPPCLVDS